ncbi:MAG: hypothetical protein ABIH49_01440 [archaeon]
MNKRAQELSVNTIILIILAVVVLVILVLGFTIGWNRFVPFISKTNVDQVISACDIACSLNNQYDYCSIPRELKAQDVTLRDVTCNFLSKQQTQYLVKTCPSIDCATIVFDEADCAEGKTLQTLNNGMLESTPCTAAA